MQGQPESPCLWEKHADAILRDIGLTPMVHEPCLYTGMINNNWVIFMCQVDDFAIAAIDAPTVDILTDMLDDHLQIPIKRQGHLDMSNGVNIHQTRDYIKLTCTTFIDKISEKYLATWMQQMYTANSRPTPFPSDANWWHDFNVAIGDPDPKEHATLAKSMQLSYWAGVGKMIWAMTTCHPDVAYVSMKLSQSTPVHTKSTTMV